MYDCHVDKLLPNIPSVTRNWSVLFIRIRNKPISNLPFYLHRYTKSRRERMNKKARMPLDVTDVEKDSNDCDTPVRESQEHEVSALKVGEDDKAPDTLSDENVGQFRKLTNYLLKWGIETNGWASALLHIRSTCSPSPLLSRITPIPLSKRTDPRIIQLFWVWFTCNFNILAFGTGSAGPAFFGLGIKDSLVILLIVDIMSVIPLFI
jgi:hypothetical protein